MGFSGIDWDTVEVKGAQFGLVFPQDTHSPDYR